MGDFLFKNLSVRLLPADDLDTCLRGSFCDPWHTCFDRMSGPGGAGCGFCTFCTYQTCGDKFTNDVVVPADKSRLREELAAHKARLQAVIEDIERREKALEDDAKPKSIEELDALRASLTDAIAELDEQRGRMQPG